MRITVGCSLALTGRFSLQGQQAERGLRLWVDDTNAAGGLLVGDRHDRGILELRVRDDASRASRAAQLAEELIVADQIDLLVGPYGSAPTLAAARVAEAHRKVLWNHGGSTDALVERGFRYVVNLPAPASRYLVGIVDLARAILPSRDRLFLASGASGTFAPTVIGGAEAYARQHGLSVVGKAVYPPKALNPGTEPNPSQELNPNQDLNPNQSLGPSQAQYSSDDNFAPLIAEIAAARPDILLGAGRLESDVALAQALRAHALDVPIVGLVGAGVADFGAQLGPAAKGIFGPSQWEPGAPAQPDLGPTSAEFAARYHARFGSEPNYPAAQAYAAGLIIERCLDVAGTLKDDAMRAAANTLDIRTFYGDFRLDPTSGAQVGHTLVIVQWQSGAKRIVWPTEIAEGEPVFSPTATSRPKS